MPEKGIRFQRYVKYKAKIDPNFGGGEKRIIPLAGQALRHTQDKDSVKSEGGTGSAPPLLDARPRVGARGQSLRGQDGVGVGSCHGEARIAKGAGDGEGGCVSGAWFDGAHHERVFRCPLWGCLKRLREAAARECRPGGCMRPLRCSTGAVG